MVQSRLESSGIAMKETYLFVYGTLRRGCGHPMHRALAQGGEYSGLGRYAGRLFDLGPYPAVVPQPGSTPTVVGELYRLPRPEAVLPVLDRYEGCTDQGDPGAEYRRERQPVIREDGTAVTAWIYLYNRPTDNARLIAGGDYLRDPLRRGQRI